MKWIFNNSKKYTETILDVYLHVALCAFTVYATAIQSPDQENMES